MKFFIVILFISVNLFNFAIADDEYLEDVKLTYRLSGEELKQIKHDLEVQKLLIEGVKKLELQNVNINNIDNKTEKLKKLVLKSIDLKTKQLPIELQAKISDEMISSNTIRNIILKTKKFLLKMSEDKKIVGSSLMRRFGFEIGIVYYAVIQIDTTLPLIMIANGYPKWGILLALPLSTAFTVSYAAVKSSIKYLYMIKKLGGWENSKKHLQVFSQMKSFFNQNIIGNYSLFDIEFNNKQYVVSFEHKKLLGRTLQRVFGWNESLHYENLVQFMLDEDLLSQSVKRIDNAQISKSQKIIQLMLKIQNTPNKDVFLKIQNKFGTFIKEIPDLGEYDSLRTWVSKMSFVKNFDDFMINLSQMPQDIPPRVFDSLWRKHILLYASKSIEPFMGKRNYLAFRNLYNYYQKELRAKFMDSKALYLSDSEYKAFKYYIYRSLQPVGSCKYLFDSRVFK